MVDRFIERVAELAGRTSRVLKQVASELEEEGYVTQPGLLKAIAKSNEALAHDCSTVTQPIDVSRYNLTDRLKRIIEEADDIAADLLSRGKVGHNELSTVSEMLREIMGSQDTN